MQKGGRIGVRHLGPTAMGCTLGMPRGGTAVVYSPVGGLIVFFIGSAPADFLCLLSSHQVLLGLKTPTPKVDVPGLLGHTLPPKHAGTALP